MHGLCVYARAQLAGPTIIRQAAHVIVVFIHVSEATTLLNCRPALARVRARRHALHFPPPCSFVAASAAS